MTEVADEVLLIWPQPSGIFTNGSHFHGTMKFFSFICEVYEKVLANENGEHGGAYSMEEEAFTHLLTQWVQTPLQDGFIPALWSHPCRCSWWAYSGARGGNILMHWLSPVVPVLFLCCFNSFPSLKSGTNQSRCNCYSTCCCYAVLSLIFFCGWKMGNNISKKTWIQNYGHK